jgi:hypothetical protein
MFTPQVLPSGRDFSLLLKPDVAMGCARDSNGKPTGRHDRGLAVNSPTRQGCAQKKIILRF